VPAGPYTHDILILADMARASDCGLRIRREIETCHKAGYSVGLRHLPTPGRSAAILPDIQHCVRAKMARVIGEAEAVIARLGIVFSPGLLKAPAIGLEQIRADKVVLVHDRAPDVAQMGNWFSFDIGEMSWAPTNRWVRAKLEELSFPVHIEAEDWRSIGRPAARPSATYRPPAQRIFGRVSAVGKAQWPDTASELEAIYPCTAAIDFCTVGGPPNEIVKDNKSVRRWRVLHAADTTLDRFISQLDVFMYFPGALTPELPETAIATALASGKVVVLPPHLKPHFGPGALYSEPRAALAVVEDLFANDDALAAYRTTARAQAKFQFSETEYLARIARLTQMKDAPRSRRAISFKSRRALFVPSNGLGMGHTSRLLATARRLEDRFEPVFASLGQVTGVLESFGYLAEYIPSYADMSSPMEDWDVWAREEISMILDRHRPEVVIFDGNHATDGLVKAVMAYGQCRLVWMRRGMAAAAPSKSLVNSRFFDCIIEPGELASDHDAGPLVARRHEAHQVAPIRLLDHCELLSKSQARAQLRLDPERPAVLLHLGSGSNFDLVDLVDRIIGYLQQFEGLQIVVAEWANGAIQMPHWPGVRILRGFPISQTFNAFDFSIAAAGYNTFHEVIALQLPTIFIADRHPSMDDQGGRAEFAQNHSLGFDLIEDDISLLPALCNALLQPKANEFLRQQCGGIDDTNGAVQAANLIKTTVDGQ
jgi:hypothetical protein